MLYNSAGCTIDGDYVKVGGVFISNGVAVQCRWKWLNNTSTVSYPTVIGIIKKTSYYITSA